MKKNLRKIIDNPFFSGSFVMVVGNNFFNLGQLIYHFLAGRILGKSGYAELAAIISVLGIITIIQLAFGLTIVKIISSQKNKDNVNNFIKWVFWWSVWIGGIVGIVILIVVPFVAKFLHINQPSSIYLLSPLILFLTLSYNGRSILQGLLKFERYVASFMVEIIAKLSLTIIFVSLGYAVFGAMVAVLISVIMGFVVVYFSLTEYLVGQRGQRPEIGPIIKYSSAVFIQGLALTSMYSVDMLLVKHFFPSDQAGIYASLAVLGRIVFFGTTPITSVMFPLAARRVSQGLSNYKLFYLALSLVIVISVGVVAIYRLFPNVIINALYGSQYLEGASILWWFGLFMGLLGIATLLTQFYLAIGRTKVVILFGLAAFLQATLIWFIHPNLISVIQMSIISAALLVLALLVYFLYNYDGEEKS